MRALAAAALVLVTGVFAMSARGAEPEPGDRAAALGDEGMSLLESQTWQAAFDRFARAEALVHSPVFVLYMARAKQGAGELVAARALFQRVVAEPLGEGAVEPWRKVKAPAEAALRDLDSSIPSLRVDLRGESSGQARLMIDGLVCAAGTPTSLDPGRHVVVIERDGAASIERTVDLASGAGVVSVVVNLPVVRAAVAPTPPAVVPAAARPSALPAYVAIGVGVAGVGLGAVTGLLAIMKTNALKRDCGGAPCPLDRRADGDSAQTLATTSTWSFAAGGVALAAGVGWLMLRRSTSSSLHVSFGPSSFTLRGAY